jgi:hypothetical protein
MNKEYPYRFKTKKEFIDEYGIHFNSIIRCRWNSLGGMDYLYGIEYPYIIDKNTKLLLNVDGWNVSWDMLTLNIKTPDYKPKKLIYE